MNRVERIRFRGEASGHAAAAALIESAGDVALDRREIDRSLVMRCPDGCGDTLTVNLDPRSGKAWRADRRGGKLTLYPSVWRDQGCKAHFILWRDQLLWCDRFNSVPWNDDDLVALALDELRSSGRDFRHFEEIADALHAIPWEVLWACQRLASCGEAEVRDRSWFRLKQATEWKARRRP